MAHARNPAAARWTSLGTSIDGLSFYLSGFMAVALAAYGVQGAVRSHLEGRRFIAASSQEQVLMMRWSDAGGFVGNPASPLLRCVGRKPVGTSSIPVEFVRHDTALCDASARVFHEIGRTAGLNVPLPGGDGTEAIGERVTLTEEGRALCRLGLGGSATPIEGMTVEEFRAAAPLCARRVKATGPVPRT